MLQPYLLVSLIAVNSWGAAVDIGYNRQLLCDSSFINQAVDVSWTVNPPEPVDTVLI